MTVFRTARGRAVPVGREEMDVRSQWFSCTHAWWWRYRGYQIFSRVQRWNIGFGPPGWGSVFSGRCFNTRGCFPLRLPSSHLRDCCGFGLRLLTLGRLPFGVHIRLLGSFRDGVGRGFCNRGWWGSGLYNTPLWITWFHPSPRSICSAEGSASCSFGAVWWAVMALCRPRSGACFESAVFASFHFT